MRKERACLRDVCSRPLELECKLTDSLWVLAANLGCVVTDSDVATLLQCEDVTAVAEDYLAKVKALQNALKMKT